MKNITTSINEVSAYTIAIRNIKDLYEEVVISMGIKVIWIP